jgi:hypothetical protein
MLRRKTLGVVALLAMAGLVGAACGGGGGTKAASREAGVPLPGGVAQAAPTPAPVPGVGGFQLPQVGARIIKSASISLEIRAGRFQDTAGEVTLVASRHGGFVASSQTSGEKHLSGTIVLRVPASQFEATMGELLALGKVKAQRISGEDVTSQFVDLEARLRNWEAQEDVLLTLMGKSTSIADSLKVQQALQDVQLAIEEIKGQLRVLGDQTDLSTITLSIAERVPVPPVAKKPNPFVRSWRAAVEGTVAVFTAILIGLGFLVPVFLMALAVGLGWLAVRRLRPKAAATP